jgi:hypothetical protein
MTAIAVLLILIILLMFKPIRVLVGFLFVVGMLGYLSNKDTDKTAAATQDKPAAVAAAKEEPKKEEEKKPPPPVPYAGQEVSKEFFDYIYPEMAYGCVEAIKRFVKYDIRSPGALYGTNNGDSAFFLLRMSRVSKRVANDGSITMAGDEAEAQNGFGNWKRISYTCTVDPVNKLVKHATLSDGRLP